MVTAFRLPIAQEFFGQAGIGAHGRFVVSVEDLCRRRPAKCFLAASSRS